MHYIFDTNVWVDVTQGKVSCRDLARLGADSVSVAPFMIMELMKSTIKAGNKHFFADQQMFRCMSQFRILELTKPFIYKLLWNIPNLVQPTIQPRTYRGLLHMMDSAKSFKHFIELTDAPGSDWNSASDWHGVHEAVIDQELGALEKIASRGSLKALGLRLSLAHSLDGMFPEPELMESRFSGALEYIRASIRKIRRGANLARNDRGLYVDFQTFFYLADPAAIIVSNEGFREIERSPQKARIITWEQFLNLPANSA